MEELSDTEFLRQRYAAARNRFRPREVRCLLVSEAPPCSLDRQFYLTDVKKQDSLFLEVMGVLYPEAKQAYLASGRDSGRKAELLQRFADDGLLLLDLWELPFGLEPLPPEAALRSLAVRLQRLVTPSTPIILVKANVYDTCFLPLSGQGYNVVPIRMPFPGSGQQRVFRALFSKALAAIKW